MKISLLHLTTNQYIISEVNELDEEPAVHLVRPYQLEGDPGRVKLIKYPKYSEGENFVLHSEKVVTIGSPEPYIIKLYMDAIMTSKSSTLSDE